MGCGDADKDRKALENAVHLKEDELETGERYAIVGMSFDKRRAFYVLAGTDSTFQHITVRPTFSSPHTICPIVPQTHSHASAL